MTGETGQTFGDRYQLVAPLGVGTSARVYLAADLQLKRRVAIKVLHESLAEDQAFLKRFRTEARTAAALSHENILSVFDWGEDHVDDRVVPYLVTEYLPGGTLRDLLDRGIQLTPSQALQVGLEVASALSHAHERGLVHRDIKPGNLLFDAQGHIRLTDFGLARALAEASWTEPVGSTIGSVRYASPELALGRRLDGRSDVYSLSLVLIESMTGEVPLLGETSQETLQIRTQEDVRIDYPTGAFRSVLERAGRIEPDARPESGELVISFLAAASDLTRPEPIPILGHDGGTDLTTELSRNELLGKSGIVFTESAGESSTRADSTSGLSGQGQTTDEIDLRSDRDDSVSRPLSVPQLQADQIPQEPRWAPSTTVAEPDRSPIRNSESVASRSEEPPLKEKKRRSTRTKVLLSLLVILLLAGIGAAGWWFFIRVPTVIVPTLVGVQAEEGQQQIEELGLVFDGSASDREDGSVPGQILRQDPEAGIELAEGETVVVTVSLGWTLAAVPDVANQPVTDAVAAIESAGFIIGETQPVHDEEIAVDVVMSVTPAPDSPAPDGQGRLPKNTVMDLVVSLGPAPRVMPEGIVGVSYDNAAAALEAVQLVPERTNSYSSSVDAGVVISTSETPGTELPRGAKVTVEVSRGPAPIEIPDVRYHSAAIASQMLEDAGFIVDSIDGSASALVTSTTPAVGELHQRNTRIKIHTRG